MSNKATGKETKKVTPGPLPPHGEDLWNAYINAYLGSPGEGQPSYYASALAGQQAYLDKQHQNYINSIKANAAPYNEAVNRAEANPIKISWGGHPVGNVMMQGGMNAEKNRLGVNMLAPQAQWDYQQKNTPYTAYLNYVDSLYKHALDTQKLAYGLPNAQTTGTVKGPDKSTGATIADWIGIANAGTSTLQGGYNLGKNFGWWGGKTT